LLEGLLGDGEEDDSVGTKTIFGGSLDILDNVLALAEVDKCVRAQFLAHLLLVITSVDGDGTDTHGLAVLLSEGTETTTSTDNGYCLARASTGFLDTLVDSDTGTQNGCNTIQRSVLAKSGDVCGLCYSVLLEGAIDSISGQLSLGAQRLVCLHAEVARKARSVDPLVHRLTACNNDTSTFVAANKRKLGWKGPVAVQGVEIGVTDTSRGQRASVGREQLGAVSCSSFESRAVVRS
ncbi:GroES-like protein, partial [Aureobasidium melanogenum]